VDVHVDHPGEDESAPGINNLGCFRLQGSVSQGLNFSPVDDDVPIEESVRGVYFAVSDDKVNCQDCSPIQPALIDTYVFLDYRC